MKLTDEQRAAVLSDSNTLLVACPGSGKTRSIVAKLLRSAEEIRGTARRVACITYTNAAVHEIENRLSFYGTSDDVDVCEVSTIHAFCLNNILARHYWCLPEFRNGYRILPPDDEYYRKALREECVRFGLAPTDVDELELVHRQPNGTPTRPGPQGDAVVAFWERLANEGFIDFPNIIYYSYKLVNEIPRLAAGLACKYSWILVDEMQDTSALQVEILKAIGRYSKTKFFLVGDPAQSIFGFAGARPDLMEIFADDVGAEGGYNLTGNFRCSQSVIEHAERLLPRARPMQAVGLEHKDQPVPEHHHVADPSEAIRDIFVPRLNELGIEVGQSAVMAPAWFSLLPVARTLRDAGIPIHGPGARPYKRSRLIARFAEEICAYIQEGSAERIRYLERSLFNLIQDATGRNEFGVFSYRGRRILFRLVRLAQHARQRVSSAGEWLSIVADDFGNVLVEEGILPTEAHKLLVESATDIVNDMLKQKVDPSSLSVESLSMFASPQECIKLITMHGSKGREFDAIALINLHDSSIPNWRSHNDQVMLDEQRRLFYVAITRARRLLMYITDDSNYRNRPSRFLAEVLS